MLIKPNGSTADFSINYFFSALLEPLQLFGNILYPKAAAGPSGGAVPRTLDGGLLLTAYVQHKQ